MTRLEIILEGDGAIADWAGRKMHHVGTSSPPIRIMALRAGTRAGAPSVAIGLALEDGSVVVAETTLSLFLAAADALRARYGDPRERS